MNEITISIEEYRMLISALHENDMLCSLLKKHLESNEAIFTDEVKTICAMLRLEVKQDA